MLLKCAFPPKIGGRGAALVVRDKTSLERGPGRDRMDLRPYLLEEDAGLGDGQDRIILGVDAQQCVGICLESCGAPNEGRRGGSGLAANTVMHLDFDIFIGIGLPRLLWVGRSVLQDRREPNAARGQQGVRIAPRHGLL